MQKSEFELGFNKTKRKHSDLNKTLAWNFICRFDRMYMENKERPPHERREFGFLMRLALNEVQIADPKERKRYASIASAIYTARKQFASSKKPSRSRRDQQPSTFDIEANDKGQFGWKL